MRKLVLAFFSSFSFVALSAQVPSGYYNNAYNGAIPKTCADLKTALFGIITADTNNLYYNSPDGSFDSQDAVNKLDIRRNDENTADIIWDMYTDNPTGPELYTFTPGANQCGGSFPPEVGACYNREHSFPLSWFGSVYPMRSDMHHLYATDGETNSRHANWPYGEVGFAEWQSPAGAKLGGSDFPGYTGKVFEPIDEYKGDFARAILYMVTCYETLLPSWQSNSNANDILNGTTWPALDDWAIKQYYKWHIQDPVSQKEINRNDSIFTFQGNRNPYIDHPEFVALVWQCTNLLPVTLLDFTAVKNNAAVLVQWNVNREINFRQYEVERSIDGISFTHIGTVTAANREQYSLADNNLPAVKNVMYRLKMMDIDGRFTYSKTVIVRLDPATGIISIYPNPAVNEITVVLPQPLQAAAVVKITDVTGKEVLRKNILSAQNNLKLQVNQLPAGRYFVSVIGNKTVLHDSFVIVR